MAAASHCVFVSVHAWPTGVPPRIALHKERAVEGVVLDTTQVHLDAELEVNVLRLVAPEGPTALGDPVLFCLQEWFTPNCRHPLHSNMMMPSIEHKAHVASCRTTNLLGKY